MTGSARQPSDRPFLSWFLLIIIALIWGSSFILIKKGLVSFGAMEVGALRIFSAGLFLLPLAISKLKTIKSRTEWLVIFIVGLCGSLIPAFLFAKAQTQLTSSVTGLINAVTPLMTLVVGAAFFNRHITRKKGIGLLVGFAGSLILMTAGTGGNLGDLNFYVLLVIAATICYGFNLNLIKTYLSKVPAVSIASVSLLLVLPVSGYYLFHDGLFMAKFETAPDVYWSFTSVLILGVVGTAIALILFNRLVHLKDPVFASSVTYLIPAVAIVWGVIDGEVLLLAHYLGIIIISVGIYMANSGR